MRSLRILHVEDEADIREVVEISLGIDPDVVTKSCGSGHEALALAVDWPPDIILLDVMMPVMDGPTTLARLRDNSQTASIPVIFMTARAQSRELDLFRSLGAIGVIPKPFDPMTLAASVRSYIPRFHNGLEALQNLFLRRITDDAAMLAWYRAALDGAPASQDILTGLRDIGHGLAGAGGIYGFADISEAASGLEDAVVAALSAQGTVERVMEALDRLLACIARDGPVQADSLVEKEPLLAREA
jgi:two-component system OmpR family response regulator